MSKNKWIFGGVGEGAAEGQRGSESEASSAGRFLQFFNKNNAF